jgi:hypothetical protein
LQTAFSEIETFVFFGEIRLMKCPVVFLIVVLVLLSAAPCLALPLRGVNDEIAAVAVDSDAAHSEEIDAIPLAAAAKAILPVLAKAYTVYQVADQLKTAHDCSKGSTRDCVKTVVSGAVQATGSKPLAALNNLHDAYELGHKIYHRVVTPPPPPPYRAPPVVYRPPPPPPYRAPPVYYRPPPPPPSRRRLDSGDDDESLDADDDLMDYDEDESSLKL